MRERERVIDLIKLYQYVFGYCAIKLGEICEIKTGKCLTKKDCIDDGQYKIISGGTDILGKTNDYNREANTVTVSRAGTAGYVDYQEEKFWVNDKCFSVIPEKEFEIMPKYLFYYLKNDEDNIMAMQSKGSVPTINTKQLGEVIVSLPSIKRQKEIIETLDNFDKMTTDLTEGLPAEIDARRKQYEYYRDKLLTFKELEN